jgi:hypothetical protein
MRPAPGWLLTHTASCHAPLCWSRDLSTGCVRRNGMRRRRTDASLPRSRTPFRLTDNGCVRTASRDARARRRGLIRSSARFRARSGRFRAESLIIAGCAASGGAARRSGQALACPRVCPEGPQRLAGAAPHGARRHRRPCRPRPAGSCDAPRFRLRTPSRRMHPIDGVRERARRASAETGCADYSGAAGRGSTRPAETGGSGSSTGASTRWCSGSVTTFSSASRYSSSPSGPRSAW